VNPPLTRATDEFPNSSRQVFRLLNNYEEMVKEIQIEASRNRDENQFIREKLGEIVSQSTPADSLETFKREYVEVSDRIFNNLRNQLGLIYQVAMRVIALSHHTSANAVCTRRRRSCTKTYGGKRQLCSSAKFQLRK
jgi:GTP1/Obg family GTP-binding protein